MNGKVSKIIKRYAKLQNFRYSFCKKIYLKSSSLDKEKYVREMTEVLDRPVVRPTVPIK